jgi:adenine deaminase
VVICADGSILAEIAFPVAGTISTEPVETIADKLRRIQQTAAGLGAKSTNFGLTLATLPSPAIPFLRICSSGLFNLRSNCVVELIVG